MQPRSKAIAVDWLRHLPADKQKDFEKLLRNNTPIFERLFDILSGWEDEISRAETKPDYSSPSWACQQAHRNGSKEILKRAKDLIGFYK